MGKKSNNKLNISVSYFGIIEEAAIKKYVESESQEERQQIFNDFIYKTFDKLCENIINTYKFYNTGYDYDTLKIDVLSFLVQKLDKFNPSKKTKAYSYFGTIAKRHLIQITRKKAKMQLYLDHEELNSPDVSKIDNDKEEFIKILIQQLLIEIKKQKDKRYPDFKYIKYLEALYLILETYHTIDYLEKKYIKIYIKQVSGLSEYEISSYQNKCKRDFLVDVYEKYLNNTL